VLSISVSVSVLPCLGSALPCPCPALPPALDAKAFDEIIDRCPVEFELNADLSHYFYRGISQSKCVLYYRMIVLACEQNDRAASYAAASSQTRSVPCACAFACLRACVLACRVPACAVWVGVVHIPHRFLPRILGKVGHMHQRMARQHGNAAASLLNSSPSFYSMACLLPVSITATKTKARHRTEQSHVSLCSLALTVASYMRRRSIRRRAGPRS
jgi:hypothetical protein